MTTRDATWRGAGVALALVGGLLGIAAPGAMPGATSAVPLIGFLIAILGVVLIVQGRRVPMAWRIERSRHRLLPAALDARRRRRRR